MLTQLEKLPKNQVKLTVTVPGEEMLAYFDAVVAELGQNVEIPGFRRGKAPKAMVVEKIGQTRLANTALERALNETLPMALKKHKLASPVPPRISIKTQPSFIEGGQNQLIYEVELDILPKAKVTGWQKIKIFQPKPEDEKVSEKDIEATLKLLRQRLATFKVSSGPIQKGDQVEIDFEGFENGRKNPRLSSRNHPLIVGAGQMVPGFEEQLLGLKTGETKEFELTFPKDYPVKEMQGKKVKFKVRVNLVRQVILPRDEELLEKLGHKDMKSLRKSLEEFVAQDKKRRIRQRQELELSQELAKRTKVEIPPRILEHETNRLKEQIIADLQQRQIDFTDYLSSLKISEAEFDQALLKQARHNILVTLALQSIGEETGIDMTEKGSLKKVVDKLISLATRKS